MICSSYGKLGRERWIERSSSLVGRRVDSRYFRIDHSCVPGMTPAIDPGVDAWEDESTSFWPMAVRVAREDES